MCLIALALDAHPRHALVIAANRDEWHERPTAGLDWWQEEGSPRGVLAGRDLVAGGTWMGLADHGRVGLLTNVRDPSRQRAAAASRGRLVSDWLSSDRPWQAPREVNPFNFVGGDLRSGRWWWVSDSQPEPLTLTRGVHGLSNAALDTPWPKLTRLKLGLVGALAQDGSRDALRSTLLALLADRAQAPDDALPDTGVGIERERWLSSAFIATPDRRYGTRCSTVVIGERVGASWHLSITERRFDASGAAFEDREVELRDWPSNGRAAVRVTPLR